MQTIRRLYVYAVAIVSLETVLWGTIGLVRSVFSGRAIISSASSLAQALSLILVGVPVFLLHWWLAQRSARQDVEERSSRLRAVFLYGALLATLVPVVQNLLALIGRSLAVAFGLQASEAFLGGDQTFSDNLIAAVVNLLVAAYLYWVLRADWAAGPSGDDYAELRRLYRYLWSLYALAMLVFGVQQLLQYVLGLPAAVGMGHRQLLANGLALLFVGLPVWVFIWRLILASLVDPGERRSLIRLVVLYLLALAGVGSVLSSAGLVLFITLGVALGDSRSLTSVLSEISAPLSVALSFGGVWAYYGRLLGAEIRSLPAAPGETSEDSAEARRAGMRRAYLYVLAFFGLAATFAGLQMLLAFLLDLALSPDAIWGSALRRNLAAALATLLVGLPLWIVAWRPLVRQATLDGEAGDHARRSLVRRSYLYLALFAGVMGVMFSSGALLFELISTLLGDPPENLLVDSLQLLKLLALFALLLIYHWFALRADGRLAERSLSRRHAQFPVLILTPEDGEFAESLVSALEREAPGLPVAVHAFSQGAPDETLSAARAVVLPAGLMAKPPESVRLWLQGFDGKRLVVPTPVTDWHWVFGSGRTLAMLSRRTARLVRHLAEGEGLPHPRDASPWMTAIYVLAALFSLQLLVMAFSLLVSLFQ